MQLPQPTHKNYQTLISDIKSGAVKLPHFQREFVWPLQDSADLMDSILKGYPIGTFIFWVTQERLRSIKNLGNIEFGLAREGHPVSYVLDGQQRLTSLYAVLEGVEIERTPGQREDFSSVYIDLIADDSDAVVVTDAANLTEGSFIRLTDLLHADFDELRRFPKKHYAKLKEYSRRIEAYDFPVIEVHGMEIDQATDIFTRVNVGGKDLSVFEIMVAKTYDEGRGFDLSVEYSKLIGRLEPLGYETISNRTVLQLVSLMLEKDCKRQTILMLDKNAFIEAWPNAVDAIEHAVDYFRRAMRIPVSQLLPYLALIVPFAYFFHRSGMKRPSSSQKEKLVDFFWRCSLGERYSSADESKLAQDVIRIDRIIQDQLPDYDWEVDMRPEHIIKHGWFSTGRSFVKAILCVMAYQSPLSFKDNSDVTIGNDWLKRANSKNYHHFFPKGFCEKAGIDEEAANNVINITIVDDYLNKHEIRDKPPSVYIADFERDNRGIAEAMQSHLIDDLDEFGIRCDDYRTFLKKRAQAISNKINSFLIDRTSRRAT